MRTVPCALALLLAVEGCDNLRKIPWLQARPPAPLPPPAVAMGPWLVDPVAGKMTVAWVTAQPSLGRVWFGTSQLDRIAIEEGKPRTEHRVALSPLRPAAQYRYRVEGAAETFLFTTAPEAGAEGPVTFLVHGHNRNNPGDHALIARAAAAERASIALNSGDRVTSAGDPELWRVWLHEERDLLARTPIVPAVGNREVENGGAADSRKPAYWSSFDYGPVHLAVLDSSEVQEGATARSPGISAAQKARLEEDLRSVPKERHVWALVQQGPSAHPAQPRRAGESDAVRDALAAAARVHPIDVVLARDAHFYERGRIEGQTYFVFGGGGAPPDDAEERAEGGKAARQALSYAIIEVCGCEARGVVKDIAGQPIDAFRLSICDKPCSSPAFQAAAAVAPLPAKTEEKRSRRRRDRRTARSEPP